MSIKGLDCCYQWIPAALEPMEIKHPTRIKRQYELETKGIISFF
jgi:hypothetical protein